MTDDSCCRATGLFPRSADLCAWTTGVPGRRRSPGWRTIMGVAPGKVVVDLGAGTGKFTKLLVRDRRRMCSPWNPSSRDARASWPAVLPGVQRLAGTCRSDPVGGGFSRCAGLRAGLSLVCHRTRRLRRSTAFSGPAGRLGLIWNVRDESVDWVATITEIIAPYEGDAPRFSKGTWRRAVLRAILHRTGAVVVRASACRDGAGGDSRPLPVRQLHCRTAASGEGQTSRTSCVP